MTKDFDYYDVIGTFATGVAAIGAAGLVYMCAAPLNVKGAFEQVHDISLGFSFLVIIFAFIVGEIVQAVAKPIEKLVFRRGGRPTSWIAKGQEKSSSVIGDSDAETIRRWVNQCCNRSAKGGEECDPRDIEHCLHRMKVKAYQKATSKKLIMNMLAKSIMFRGFTAVAILTMVISLMLGGFSGFKTIAWELGEGCFLLRWDATTGFEHGGLTVLIIVCVLLLPFFIKRYVHHYKLYARALFSAFIEEHTGREAAILSAAKPETPSDDQGGTSSSTEDGDSAGEAQAAGDDGRLHDEKKGWCFNLIPRRSQT